VHAGTIWDLVGFQQVQNYCHDENANFLHNGTRFEIKSTVNIIIGYTPAPYHNNDNNN